ncbi:MAG: MotA/TolQ/ExbB proton channel family protein [Gemmatimonadales bacterium]
MQADTMAVPRGIVDLILDAKPETTAVLLICAVFSVASWYIIASKWWEFRRLDRSRNVFEQAMERTRSLDEREQAMLSLGASPFAEVVRSAGGYMADLRAAMQRDNVTRSGLSLTQLEALTMTLDAEVRSEADELTRMLPWLATIGAVAPLLGLLGTVLGIMQSFLGIAEGGSGNIAAVAPGIADALVATAAGLFAAIPAVMAYNLFTARVERVESELERLAQDTIGALGREGRL